MSEEFRQSFSRHMHRGWNSYAAIFDNNTKTLIMATMLQEI